LTALNIIQTCENRPKILTDLGLLQVVCNTSEVPVPPMRRVEQHRIERFLEENREQFFRVPDPVKSPEDYEMFLDSLKTAVLMKAWVDETGEGEIYERFGVEPGDLAVLRERTSWMAYSASQLMMILAKKNLMREFDVLSSRLEHGVKEELLPLVVLQGVGRVRARNLYNAGYRNLEDLRKASVEELSKVPSIGQKIASLIKSQV
ncbi:MAG: helix-hairpin-helix domain-containing protein, partial [Candidatus Caldarchaeum sp.]|nr:helix-hairpin-helix domain-containing protein [Candidatus Caldarchaeum sp.]